MSAPITILSFTDPRGDVWEVAQDAAGFRLICNGRTAPHNLCCNRVYTLAQTFDWLAVCMKESGK